MTSLTIPPAVQADDKAVQMLSAWIAKKGLHCAIDVSMWEAQGHDAGAAWGILLADVIRQIAQQTREKTGRNPDDTMEAIIDSLLGELNEPVSSVATICAPA